MSSATTEVVERHASPAGKQKTWFRPGEWLLYTLNAFGNALEKRTWLCFAILTLCYVPVVIAQAQSKLLVNDEIYTVHIAAQPTLRRMLWLAREIDLHPPLHYLLQRWALHIPAPRWFVSRLPSMLAGLVVTLSAFRFTARRLGNLMGMLTACVFWFTPALDFSWVNRPYQLWLGFLCLLLLARDRAHRPGRPRWVLPLVFLLTLCMVMTHLLGIACLGFVALGEFVRRRRTGKLDYGMLLALLLPALVGVGFYYQFHHLSQNAFPEGQLPSSGLLLAMYMALFGNTAAIIGGCVLGFAMFFGPRPNATEQDLRTRSDARRFSPDDLTVLIGLLLLPVLLFLPAIVLHLQFWFRYAGASMPAMAILSAWFVARKLPLARPLAAVVVLCGISYMAYVGVVDTPPQTNSFFPLGGRWPTSLWKIDPNLPIVSASPMTFVEMADREPPEIARRVYYLTDKQAAYDYSHYTLFENEGKIKDLLNLPTQTDDLGHFLTQHHQFYVVGAYPREEIWLLRKLAADGQNLQYLGKFDTSYETDDLWLVTVERPNGEY